MNALTQFQEQRIMENRKLAYEQSTEEQARNMETRPHNEYFPILFWCNTHRRQATHIHRKTMRAGLTTEEHVCDPKLGGIMIPCQCVDLTGIAEVTIELPPAATKEET